MRPFGSDVVFALNEPSLHFTISISEGTESPTGIVWMAFAVLSLLGGMIGPLEPWFYYLLCTFV